MLKQIASTVAKPGIKNRLPEFYAGIGSTWVHSKVIMAPDRFKMFGTAGAFSLALHDRTGGQQVVRV
jgi:hypothetical protein